MVNYDAYATTFSNSRKNLHWGELDAIIEDMRQCGYTSVLDVGCGNGRFLEAWNIGETSELEVGGKKMKTQNGESEGEELSESDDSNILMSEANEFFSPSGAFGTFQSGKVHNNINYLGIDNSAGMIAEARKLHPDYQFEACPMESLGECDILEGAKYDAIIFLASFHHLETREERIQVLRDIGKYLTPDSAVYMTNWNLREQLKYEKSHRGDGDYDIKIGEFSRYYHGFITEELAELFHETGYQIVENRVFEGGRNIWSKIIL